MTADVIKNILDLAEGKEISYKQVSFYPVQDIINKQITQQ